MHLTPRTCGRCPWRVVAGVPIAPPPKPPATAHWNGLGDVVASVTKVFGIKPCGPCNERRRWLNRMVPFW